MVKFKSLNYLTFVIAVIAILYSCKSKNYIPYYNQVNKIDSTFQADGNELLLIKNYKKLFSKYSPVDNSNIGEYETYVKISFKNNTSFGGKKSLKKLTNLIAPYWRYKKNDLELIRIYQKYGIDTINLQNQISKWERNLDRRLVDSFSNVFFRDQELKRSNVSIMLKNDKLNSATLKWCLINYGYPSKNKIGLYGNNDVFMPMGSLLNHMFDTEEYDFFKENIHKFVLNGSCAPNDYARMIDKHYMVFNSSTFYGAYLNADTKIDTVAVNINRRSIGLAPLYKKIK